MNTMCIFILSLFLCSGVTAVDRGNLYVFKIVNETQNILFQLKENSFELVFKITPTTYIFRYNGYKTTTHVKADEFFSKKILEAEQVKILRDIVTFQGETTVHHDKHSLPLPDVAQSNYYGMGIEQAWAMGYSGEGVTIGVVGIGMDTNLIDLKENINTDLSFNFVQNNTNVAPERFQEIHPETNHGNNVASIIGAVKGNNVCSAGIAFRSSIAVLKVFELADSSDTRQRPWTMSDVTARALVHKLHDIAMLVLAWSFSRPFYKLDIATREALLHGFRKGRHDLGRIYVVAAGPVGNELTNNIYTITVNGMGKYGAIPQKTFRDISVLTSGLTDGNSLTSSYMFTSIYHDQCSIGFNGVSAATSQVAGILALALQANPHLSARNIQHLIVRSCHVNGFKESSSFRRNGAGRFYHPYFGFGLLNATTMITRTKSLQKSSNLLFEELGLVERTFVDSGIFRQTFCHSCNARTNVSCTSVIEHVVLTLDIKTNASHLSLMVFSPSGTRSMFLENSEVTNGTVSGKLVSPNFWDEIAPGFWTVKLFSVDSGNLQINITKLSIGLYGTNEVLHYFNDRKCGNMTYTSHEKKTVLRKHINWRSNNLYSLFFSLVIPLIIIMSLYIYYEYYIC